jgi:hypothetical protein
MSSTQRRRAETKVSGTAGTQGLFRTILAGAGHTLGDAFARLEQAPQAERVWRHTRRDLLGARIT